MSRTASNSDALDALVAFVCVASATSIGFAVFTVPVPVALTLGPLGGIIAALVCRRWLLAALAAGLGVSAGLYLGGLFSLVSKVAPPLPATYAVVIAVAAAMAAAVAALLGRFGTIERWVAWAGVALVVLTACVYGWNAPTLLTSVYGYSPAELYTSTPAVTGKMTDEEAFVLAVRRVQDGSDYYSAMRQTLTERNAAWLESGSTAQISLRRPNSYRMPTLYRLLAALPPGWESWAAAMLLLVSGGIIATWSVLSRYLKHGVALAGTVVSGSHLATLVWFHLPFTEVWAGVLGLVAVGLALKSLSVRRYPLAWASAAAVVALTATLTRELAVAFLLIGLGSALVTGRTRSMRLWIPWAVALACAGLAYFGHAQAVRAAAHAAPSQGELVALSYFDPSGKGLVAVIVMLTQYSWWPATLAWVLWLLGAVGGALAPVDVPRRVLLGGVTLGGTVAMLALHPNAVWEAVPPGYWGYVVLPSVIACAPLAFARIPRVGRARRS